MKGNGCTSSTSPGNLTGSSLESFLFLLLDMFSIYNIEIMIFLSTELTQSCFLIKMLQSDHCVSISELYKRLCLYMW